MYIPLSLGVIFPLLLQPTKLIMKLNDRIYVIHDLFETRIIKHEHLKKKRFVIVQYNIKIRNIKK